MKTTIQKAIAVMLVIFMAVWAIPFYGCTSLAAAQSHSHTYSDWEVSVPATCTDNGKQIRTCSVCGDVQTRITAVLEHTPGEWIVDRPPECTAQGSRHTECTVCKRVLETQVLAPLGHSYSPWDVTQEATCNSIGSRTHTCSVCGYTEIQQTPKLSHADNNMDGTCDLCSSRMPNMSIFQYITYILDTILKYCKAIFGDI